MNHEVQDLLSKANIIINKTGNKPGTRYPSTLKKIVTSLRLDHNMSVKDITKYIGVSTYSAREWPKSVQKKNQFNKISIVKKPEEKTHVEVNKINYSKELITISLNLKILIVLITLLIFELLILHLS